MIVHPAIACLRGPQSPQTGLAEKSGDRTSAQRNADTIRRVRDKWLMEPAVRAIAQELTSYARGTSLSDCPHLTALTSDLGAARALIDRLCAVMIATTRAAPLCEVPFRFKTSRGLSNMQLFDAGTAKLSLTSYEPLPGQAGLRTGPPTTALFADCDAREIIVSGCARGTMHCRRDTGHLHNTEHRWKAGDVIETTAQVSARQVRRVENTLLVLQLSREPAAPEPTVEISLEDGGIIRTATGDKSASQALMAIGVLGALGARSALDAMRDTALNRREDNDVRWEAVRQTLSLDAARGLSLLADLDQRADDALASPARSLMARLFAAQPALRTLTREHA